MENYAVVEVGGKQFIVKKGDVLKSELIEDAQPGKALSLDKVLFVSDGKDVKIGKPFVKGAVVKCNVDKEIKDKKVLTQKYRRRNSSKVTRGHRQKKLQLTVTDIKL